MNEMMRLVREVVSDFTEDITIPDKYFEMILYVWRRMNEKETGWDEIKAAAVLLCIMYRDGKIHQDQIKAEGNLAMKWAENYLEDTDVVVFIAQYNRSVSKPVIS